MNKIVEVALSQWGVKEIKGEVDNPAIVKYFNEIGHTWVKDDETAWCSAFINWCALKAGLEKSGALNARSWLNKGINVDNNPNIGDIVIFWRESRQSWKGHVGIFIKEKKGLIYTLGGNQSGGIVNIKGYPVSKFLGYRRLREM